LAKQVLITGGAGFVGSHLTEALLSRGCRVTVLDDESTGSTRNLAAVWHHFDFHYVKGSASDPALLAKLLPEVDEIYHLAAAVGVGLIAQAPIDSIRRNLQPVDALLQAMLERWQAGQAIKLFLASSSEVYGRNPKPVWNEKEALVFGPTTHMRWSYGAAKAMDEFLALAYRREHHLPVVIGRLFNVIGPRQRGSYGMVLPRMIDAALRGGPIIVHDDGQQVRCFAHVKDVCRMIVDLMRVPAAEGHIFNIGSAEPITILDLAQRVASAVDPNLPIEFQSYRQAYSEDFQDVRRRVPDLTKLQQTVDYRLQYDLDATIRESVEARSNALRAARKP